MIFITNKIDELNEKYNYDGYTLTVLALYGTSYFKFYTDIDKKFYVNDVFGDGGDIHHSRPIDHDDEAYNKFENDSMFLYNLPYSEYISDEEEIPVNTAELVYIVTNIEPFVEG